MTIWKKDPSHFENHHNRQEIKEAIIYGSGYSINRQSESLGGEFFYSAKYYPNLDYIIRFGLPYNQSDETPESKTLIMYGSH